MQSSLSLMQQALRGEKMPRPPVWFMRQAGRTDPEYNAYKAKLDLLLEDMFCNPEVSAYLTVLPRRIGVDALIYYQDILTILGPMGARFVFRPGPELLEPLPNAKDLKRLQLFDVRREMPYVQASLSAILAELKGELPLLGFAGAPLTLLAFLIEGRSFAKGTNRFKDALQNEKPAVHQALRLLTTMTIDYLKFQAESGVLAVQLFESAAHFLTADEYQEFALPYQQEIFQALRGHVATICFAHNWRNAHDLKASGADVVSLPAGISLAAAREMLGDKIVLQGNISNQLLRSGTFAEIETAVIDCIEQGGCLRHILNLDHGLLPDTPFENVKFAVKVTRDYSKK